MFLSPPVCSHAEHSSKRRSPPRWGWTARPAPCDRQHSPTPDHKLKQTRWLLKETTERKYAAMCILCGKFSPLSCHTQSAAKPCQFYSCDSCHSAVFSFVAITAWLSSPGHPQPCSSAVQSTDASSWICGSGTPLLTRFLWFPSVCFLALAFQALIICSQLSILHQGSWLPTTESDHD